MNMVGQYQYSVNFQFRKLWSRYPCLLLIWLVALQHTWSLLLFSICFCCIPIVNCGTLSGIDFWFVGPRLRSFSVKSLKICLMVRRICIGMCSECCFYLSIALCLSSLDLYWPRKDNPQRSIPEIWEKVFTFWDPCVCILAMQWWEKKISV